MSALGDQVAEANARIAARHAAGSNIHGGFYIAGDDDDPLAIVTCGMHCDACAMQVGGAFDLELEPHVRGVEEDMLRQLAEKGCPHAGQIVLGEGIRSRKSEGT
jgi:tetrahydromethanopterin S-methyltransferase subunit A